jgi:hypothetical protein
MDLALQPPAVVLPPLADTAALLPPVGRAAATLLPDYAAVTSFVEGHGHRAAMPSPRVLRTTGSALWRASRWLARSLTTVAPRVGVVLPWYTIDSMVFTLACRRVGVPVVDLQHGLQDATHFAYAHWHRVPASRWSLVPDQFWLWSDKERDALNRTWSGAGQPGVAVLGDPSRSDFAVVASDADRRRLDDVCPADASEGLVTLSGVESDRELDAIATALGRSPDRWFWWVREHPNNRAMAAALDRRLAASGAPAESSVATAVPLDALLSRVDVHVTGASTVTELAADAGVPTVLMSSIGAERFAREIEAGVAVAADGPSAAFAAAVDQAGRMATRSSRVDLSPGIAWLDRLASSGRAGEPRSQSRVS